MKPTMGGRMTLGRVALAGWIVATGLALFLGYRMLLAPPPEPAREVFPVLKTTAIFAAPWGHAYQYVAAPNLTWDAARLAAGKRSWRGKRGYLATIDDPAEYEFIMHTVFPGMAPDVTYLGGRQTAAGEWRWIAGPDAAEDGGRGRLFWTGDEKGTAPPGRYATWMFTAFQHGGKWDVAKVCCATLFSYGLPQLSTSLGNGDPEEGVSGYLVEFGD